MPLVSYFLFCFGIFLGFFDLPALLSMIISIPFPFSPALPSLPSYTH